jgi:hypothetical protein
MLYYNTLIVLGSFKLNDIGKALSLIRSLAITPQKMFFPRLETLQPHPKFLLFLAKWLVSGSLIFSKKQKYLTMKLKKSRENLE